MTLGFLTPYRQERLDRIKNLGLSSIQLRIGPGFPIATDDQELREAIEAFRELDKQALSVHALGFYRNMLDPNPETRKQDWAALDNVLQLAERYNIGTIGVFAGRDPQKNLEDSFDDFFTHWTPVIDKAEKMGVTLAFENCTMYRGYPLNGINMTYCPAAYERIFEEISSPAAAIEFDPSHCVKQRIRIDKFIDQFHDRIAHVHLKDHERFPEMEQQYGCFDPRVSQDRYPGYGMIDFQEMIEQLRGKGYNGVYTIEAERDPLATDEESIHHHLLKSVQLLRPFVEKKVV